MAQYNWKRDSDEPEREKRFYIPERILKEIEGDIENIFDDDGKPLFGSFTHYIICSIQQHRRYLEKKYPKRNIDKGV